jgi:hypothetical protein
MNYVTLPDSIVSQIDRAGIEVETHGPLVMSVALWSVMLIPVVSLVIELLSAWLFG